MDESKPISRSSRQWQALAKIRILKGEQGAFIEAEFVKLGLEAQAAKEIVDKVVRNARLNALRLLIGSTLFALLGLYATRISYSNAVISPSYDGYSIYYIWFGPVLAGGIGFMIALKKILTIKR